MRLIAALFTLMALALAALAAQSLWQQLAAPTAQANQPVAAQPDAPSPAPSAALPPRHWPALFGEPQPPKPPSPAVQTSAEPQPPKPPIDSLGYVLKGRVQSGQSTWAIVSHPTGEQLVREGDTLQADVEVIRIDADGLWVSRQGDAPELLGFAE